MLKVLIIKIFLAFLLTPSLVQAETQNNWLTNIRIQGQTGLSYGFLERKSFLNAAKEFKMLGAKSYTRHLKLDWRPPLWPSRVPIDRESHLSLLRNEKNYLKGIVTRANKENLKVVAYYWDGGEGTPQNTKKNKLVHPTFNYNWNPPKEWFCRDKNGSPILATLKGKARGYHLDIASNYKEFVLTRLKELVSYGVSGIYFDERHYPKAELGGCFGSSTQKEYESLIGYKLDLKNLSQKETIKYLRFQSLKMVDTFAYWKDQLHNTFPKKDIPLIISGTYLSAYILPHMSLKLAYIADSVKIEFSHGIRRSIDGGIFRYSLQKSMPPLDIRLALGWAIPRDASSGRPPHIWKHNHKNIRSIRQFISTIIGYGGIAALHTPEQYLGGDRKPRTIRQHKPNFDTEYEILKKGFQYGNRLSKVLSKTKPFTFSAIYLSENYRNRFFAKEDVWNAVMKPVTAAYHSIIREGLPVGLIVDEQLTIKKLKNYRLLYYIEKSITPYKLKILKKALPKLVFIPIIKSYDKKYSEIIKEISSSISANSHLSLFQTKALKTDKVHSIFHKGENNRIYISLLSGFEDLTIKSRSRSKKIKNLKVVFKNKPKYVLNPLSQTTLKINKGYSNSYMVEVPPFQDAYFLEIGF